MKKSLFFKFFLFTVIATMVTFTACKDYDDDISDLQNQITNLSGVKTDLDGVKADITAAKASASAAQTAANDALAKANEALKAAANAGDADAIAAAQAAADKAQGAADAAQAKVDKVEAEAERLLGLIEALEGRINVLEALDSPSKQDLEDLKAEVALIQEDAAALTSKMVTSVSLIDGKVLKFSTITEKENVFVKGLPGALTFTKDKQIQSGDNFIIQVSPANAEITKEMITLQNGLGDVYDNVVVTAVERHTDLMTRASANTGLWKVTVELKEYNKKAFNAATTANGKNILFAVSLGENERNILSLYDLELTRDDAYTPAGNLYYFVGDKHVKGLRNRTTAEELVWIDSTKPSTTPTKDNATKGDDRSLINDLYPAIQGQPIKIALTSKDNDDKVTPPSAIRGMYVTLDKKANASTTEWNAWNSYDYEGLGTVVEATETEIIINSETALTETIGFRVYAVNHDGTLVDPDGKAFYVNLGGEASDWNAVNTVVTAGLKDASSVSSAKVATTLSKLTGATKYEWTTYGADGKADVQPAFNVHFEDKAKDEVFATTANTGTVSKDFSDVTNVYTIATSTDWLDYKDDHVYNGKLTIKNDIGHVLATLNVTFKKELPGVPAGFSVKDKQIVDGVLKAYMLPTAWDATTGIADKGKLNLYEIFNYPNDNADNFETTFATSTNNKKDPLTVEGADSSPNDLTVENSYIDNTTEHATKVAYNYGEISTETKTDGAVSDYIVTVKEFNTVYSNIYNSYNWEWATREQLISLGGNYETYYGAKTDANYTNAMPTNEVTYGIDTKFNLAWIYGVSSYDGEYNTSFSLPYNFTGGKMYKITNVKLVSNTSDVEEYFTSSFDAATGIVALTKVEGGANNPTSNVPSTLKVEGTDMYGKAIKFETPVIVKPRTTP